MCLIVDVHVAPQVFVTPSAALAPVWEALSSKRACAYYGGRLLSEYRKVGKLGRLLIALDRQGILRRPVRSGKPVSDEDINRLEDDLRSRKVCRSDDEHIIALAKLSSARLLCSNDHDLHRDFTNPRILKPPGGVYQDRSHLHLIREHCSPQPKGSKRGWTRLS